MYATNLSVKRLGPNYLVITGYVGTVKKTLPVEPDELRNFITNAEYVLSLTEHSTDGYPEPKRGTRKLTKREQKIYDDIQQAKNAPLF